MFLFVKLTFEMLTVRRQQTALIFDSQKDVLEKVSKFLKQKNVSTQGWIEPPGARYLVPMFWKTVSGGIDIFVKSHS